MKEEYKKIWEGKDFVYNPCFPAFKKPIGSALVNEEIEITLYINKYYNINNLKLVLYNEEKEVLEKNLFINKTVNMYSKEYNAFKVKFFIDKPYLYWYYFRFEDCYGIHYLGYSYDHNVILVNENVQGFQLNVYEKVYDTDFSWYKGKIMYQIFPDRFNRGKDFINNSNRFFHDNWNDIPNYKPVNGKILNNDFFGGNFTGIIDKIKYLKSMNVGVIYLNPIFSSPSNHRYDTSDYLSIDALLGNEEDFDNLVNRLKEAGINIILDGVFNHTGSDSIYFNKENNFNLVGAYQSKESNYYSWYKFIDYPNKYESWWGIETLPAVNQESSFSDFITKEVIKKWLKFGINGFRLDVVDEISEAFLRKISKSIKEESHKNIVIGEVWEDASNKISYGKRRKYFDGNELDSVMNYPIKEAIIDYLKNGNGLHLVYALRTMINNYPKHNLDLMMNILSTHDTSRLMTEFSNVNYYTLSLEERANFKLGLNEYYISRSKLKMAYAILYTLPGIPCLYYGDETGLEGYKDPFCRKTINWNNIDNDIYLWFVKLGSIREDDVFVDGIYEELFYDNGVFAYKRYKGNKAFITIVNNSSYDYCYKLDDGYDLLNDLCVKDETVVHPQTVSIIRIKCLS